MTPSSRRSASQHTLPRYRNISHRQIAILQKDYITEQAAMGCFQSKLPAAQISDADLQKYTNKTRGEFDKFATSTSGVGKNQLAGTVALGPASGHGGVEAGQ